MASFTVTFDTEPESTEDVKAHYYQVEDGWFHFKDSSGEQIASYREGDVVSVERQTEEAGTIHVSASSFDPEVIAKVAAQSAKRLANAKAFYNV